jgi:hypothetical protein
MTIQTKTFAESCESVMKNIEFIMENGPLIKVEDGYIMFREKDSADYRYEIIKKQITGHAQAFRFLDHFIKKTWFTPDHVSAYCSFMIEFLGDKKN